MHLQVLNSPFNQEQAELLNQLLPTLTSSQKVWLSGFLAAASQNAFAEGTEEVSTVKGAELTITKEVTILYGSQSGNAKRLAEDAAKTMKGRGFQATVSSMSDFKGNSLKKIQNLLVIVSTHGEGAPPDNALSFYEFLHSKRAPKLDGLHFSVLALGDSSYEFFCKTGKDFDSQLEKLGGSRIYPRFDCDLDYEEPAAEWLDGVLNGFGEAQGEAAAAVEAEPIDAAQSSFSRTNPFRAEVLENINLNGRGSNKETHHLELSLEGSGLVYKPGDALGIYPENDPALVDQLLNELKWGHEEKVTINKQGDACTLREALTSHYEITSLSKPLVDKIAKLSKNKNVHDLLLPGSVAKLRTYIDGRDILDFIRDFGPWGESAEEFVSILRKIPARLYSIASSFSANPEEVHLTIGTVRYETQGRLRNGVCSVFCAERLQPGDTLPVFIQHNDMFKLPKSPDTPIIMIGPGTGVAPFRSFLQEREETGASGKTWLFFGDQHFVTDFLYQTEWQKWVKDGVLTKMDVAFSRDTEKKVYVQHRLLEKSKELFAWIEEGAVVYICGDEKNMAKDVHRALIEIIEKEGSTGRERAEEYLAELQKQGRYLRDVY